MLSANSRIAADMQSPPRRLVIVPSRMPDVYRMAANLRDGDRDEIVSLGLDPRHGIRDCFRRGILTRSAFIDGELAAMWGLCAASLVGDEGTPWLVTTKVAERLPVQFLKVGRAMLGQMLAIKPRLSNHVPASYTKAVRFVRALGFTVDEAKPMPPHGALFHHFHIGGPDGR